MHIAGQQGNGGVFLWRRAGFENFFMALFSIFYVYQIKINMKTVTQRCAFFTMLVCLDT